ncbi:MAG: riboflavin synthase [Acidobacteria bacterium]|nr:MAG: riboflavin synthase [Acidobacteriota bacterium]REK08422.1 MAG: riboflavin synthase [Acidobacteriota bacterium]
MFTGITRGTFPVVAVERRPGLLRYTVELSPELAQGAAIGASVSIDGVCQTIAELTAPPGDAANDPPRRLTFDAIAETLDKTTLGELEVGSRVSVERSLRAGDEIGGHEVAGHVVGTGVLGAREERGGELALRIDVPREWSKYLLHKGFVAVDGSSLTVGEVFSNRSASGNADAEAAEEGTAATASFWIHLIPETLRLTNLGRKQVGDRVNVELDARTVALVDTVERLVEPLVARQVERALSG